MANLKNTVINDTGNLTIPTGTTGQRPASPQNGYTRYNTSLNYIEYYQNGVWYKLDRSIDASATGADITNEIVENGVRYRVHTFYGSGSITISRPGEVEYLLVAGGGGGGAWVGGGGGAGGFLNGKVFLSAGTYPISVGGGGTNEYNPGSYSGMPRATNGGDTTAFGLTAVGGGRGGSWAPYNALTGGSGGGEGYSDPSRAGTPGQGFPGGRGRGSGTNGYPTGGGGGAGGPGGDWTASKSGDGGIGRDSRISGTQVWYAGGGGGGIHGANSNAQPGNGGKGGGGYGDAPNADDSIGTPDSATTGSLVWDNTKAPTGRDGSEYTGGGGGASGRSGGRASYGGSGGSGVAIVRYKISNDISEAQINQGFSWGGSSEGLVFGFDGSDPESLPDYSWDNRQVRNKRGALNNGNFSFNNFPLHSGRCGGALFLDNNGYMTLPYNAEIMDFRLGQTIAVWMRPTSMTGRKNIYDQAYGGSGTWTHEPNGSINWYFGTNGGNGSPYVGRTSPFTVQANETAFVVGTRDQVRNEQIWYKNGVLQGTYNAGGYTTTTNSTANIRVGLGYAGYWKGYVFMMLVYNRPLSSLEVKQIYDATKHRFDD